MTDIYKSRSYDLKSINGSWTLLGLPEDMSGLSFLDVGCWCGGHVKVAEERGAEKAVGLDYVRSPYLHDINFILMDVFSEKFLQIEQFDIVLCKGVLYHVENPMSFIFRLKTKIKQKLILETLVKNGDKHDEPYMFFLPDSCTGKGSRNYTNWWQPTVSCVEEMLKAADFYRINLESLKSYEPTELSVDTGDDHRWRAAFSCEPVNATCNRMLPRNNIYMKD